MPGTIAKTEIHFSHLGESLEEPLITGLMSRALQQPELISLAAGFTDNAKLPQKLVQQAFDELSKEQGLPDYLQYGTNQGRPALRELTAKHLSNYPNEKRENFSSKNVFITNGSQQALYLAIQVLCNPGDIVLVEGPSYFVFLEMLKGLGVQAISLPTTPNGHINVEQLTSFFETLKTKGQLSKVKAVYIDSYYANPTAQSIPLENKIGLADALKSNDLFVPIIEDGAYRDLCFEALFPVPSIISLPQFDPFPKLYLGTYTKPLVSGFRIGFGCCTHESWLQKMLYVKGHHDFGSANFTQALIEIILKNDWYEPWLQMLRAHYKSKIECFKQTAEKEKLNALGWSWETPEGGLMLWLRGPENLDTSLGSAFCDQALENGVYYVPGDLCFAERSPKNYVRISFGALDLPTLEEGVKRFTKTAKEF